MENDTYTLKSKQIPLNSSYDVIVVGGGPAGCTAAAAAAREGARTLLVEATGSLGGMGTSGLVPAWCPFSDKEKMVYRGLAAKVFNTLKAQMPHVREDAMDWVPIEPEKLKRVYDDLVTESGAHILFLTALADVERDDHGNITTLLLLNKGGLQAFRAAVYVDCTGDGDVAAWAGAECQMGDEETGELQPTTHCFILGNVDDYAYLNGPKLHAENPHSPIHEVVRSGNTRQFRTPICATTWWLRVPLASTPDISGVSITRIPSLYPGRWLKDAGWRLPTGTCSPLSTPQPSATRWS